MENNDKAGFFPTTDYKVPVTSDWLNKFPQGETNFRVLTPAIVGYEYFNSDNKPIRSQEQFDETPNMKKDGSVKHFWAFVVWNYEAERVQILELTQKSIMTPMKALIDNPKWGDPRGYDITITRTGTNMNDTEYSVMPNPHSPVNEDIAAAFLKKNIKLEAMFTGGDPFKAE